MAAVSRTRIHFDAIIARVTAGESITVACAAFGIKRPTFEAFLRHHPDYAARYQAAKPVVGMAAVEARFDEVMERIANGGSLDSALSYFGLANVTFHKLMLRRRDLKARFVAATETRNTRKNRKVKTATMAPRVRWSEADFDRALDVIRKCDLPAYEESLGGDLPGQVVVNDKARRDPAFAVRLREAVESRPRPVMYDLDAGIAALRKGRKRSYRHVLRAATGQKWPSSVLARLREHSDFKEAMRLYRIVNAPKPKSRRAAELPSGQLHSEMLKIAAYQAAWKMFRGADYDTQQDAIGEFMLAVLEGEAEPKASKQNKRTYRSKAIGKESYFARLDAPAWDSDESSTLGEITASPCGISIY